MDNKLLDELIYGVHKNIEAYISVHRFVGSENGAHEEVLRIIHENIEKKMKQILDLRGCTVQYTNKEMHGMQRQDRNKEC